MIWEVAHAVRTPVTAAWTLAAHCVIEGIVLGQYDATNFQVQVGQSVSDRKYTETMEVSDERES